MGINSKDPTLPHGNYEFWEWQLENCDSRFPAFQFSVAAFADWVSKTDRRITVVASFTLQYSRTLFSPWLDPISSLAPHRLRQNSAAGANMRTHLFEKRIRAYIK